MNDSNIFEQMENAIENNNIKKFEALLSSSNNNLCNSSTDFRYSLLMRAAHCNNKKAVRLLLQTGVDPNASNIFGHTALRFALVNKNLDMVNLLLQAGADPDYADEVGHTDLMWAVGTKVPDIIDAVFKHSKPSSFNAHLKYAVQNDKWEAAALLLEHGADPNISYADDITLLLKAAKEGSPKLVKLLLKYGADPNVADEEGTTPLMVAAGNARKKVVELLLQYGADPDIPDKNAQTPLMWLAEKPHRLNREMLKSFKIWGFGEQDEDRKSYQFCMKKVESITKMLLKKRVVIQIPNAQSALVKASLWGNSCMVKVLLGYCTDSKVLNEALMKAVSGMLHFVADMVIFRSVDSPLKLHLSSYKETIKLLLEAEASPNVRDELGITAFIKASQIPAPLEFFKIFFKFGADPHAKSLSGTTALNNAVLVGNVELIMFLLDEYHVDVNACHKPTGITPLMEAVRNDNEEIVKLLLQHKADADLKDMEGRTALIWAAKKKHWKLISLLLEASGNVLDARDRKGMTALAYARCNGAPESITFLLSF